MQLAANPILHQHTKHFELNLHFVCDKVMSKDVYIVHAPSQDQIVDILTKPLSASSSSLFKSKLSCSLYTPKFEGGC